MEELSWINPKLTLRDSEIEGTGYFAREKIQKDETLIVQSGQCVHINDIDNQSKAPNWYVGFQIETDVYYFPHNVDGKTHFEGIFSVNHSCDPNAGFRGQITLVATRDISVGEEITYDYAMTDIETKNEDAWEPQNCLCHSQQCRKIITGDDWRLPAIRERYKGYFSTHVTNAINREG